MFATRIPIFLQRKKRKKHFIIFLPNDQSFWFQRKCSKDTVPNKSKTWRENTIKTLKQTLYRNWMELLLFYLFSIIFFSLNRSKINRMDQANDFYSLCSIYFSISTQMSIKLRYALHIVVACNWKWEDER